MWNGVGRTETGRENVPSVLKPGTCKCKNERLEKSREGLRARETETKVSQPSINSRFENPENTRAVDTGDLLGVLYGRCK